MSVKYGWALVVVFRAADKSLCFAIREGGRTVGGSLFGQVVSKIVE